MKLFIFLPIITVILGITIAFIVYDSDVWTPSQTKVYTSVKTDKFEITAHSSVMYPGILHLRVKSTIPYEVYESWNGIVLDSTRLPKRNSYFPSNISIMGNIESRLHIMYCRPVQVKIDDGYILLDYE